MKTTVITALIATTAIFGGCDSSSANHKDNTTMVCEMSGDTPDEFVAVVPRMMQTFQVTFNKKQEMVEHPWLNNAKPFALTETTPTKLVYTSGEDTIYLNRENLTAIVWTKDMVDLGAYYGNSREPGADYACKIVVAKF